MTDTQKTRLSSALEALGGGNQAERGVRIAQRIMALLGHYPEQIKDERILKIMTDDWLDELDEYPYYAVEMACKCWMKKPPHTFRPKIHEIAPMVRMYGRKWKEIKDGISDE